MASGHGQFQVGWRRRPAACPAGQGVLVGGEGRQRRGQGEGDGTEPGWAPGTRRGEQRCPTGSHQGPGLDAAAELLYPLCPNLSSACW